MSHQINGQYLKVYEYVYEYKWRTRTDALPLVIKDSIDDICDQPWGWFFDPLDYLGTDVAGNVLILSFASKHDLAICKLCFGDQL